MNLATAGVAGLAGFGKRLQGGVYRSVRDALPSDLEFREEDALRHWPGDAFVVLGTIRGPGWSPRGEPAATIENLAGQMRLRRPLLLAVLVAPEKVLARLLESRPEPLGPGQGVIDGWIAMCWTAEAAWSAVKGELPAADGYAAGDAALLRPLAARLRFLVLSEPARWRGKPDEAWWGWGPDRVLGGNGVLGRALGSGSWHLLVGRSLEARREWLGVLDNYQSHPLLSQAKPDELEQELRTVVFRDGRAGPLGLSVKPLNENASPTAEDRSMIADVIERHLLPRFAVPDVARLVLYDDNVAWRWYRRVVGAAAALSGLAAVGCAAALDVQPAVIVAAACYLLICLSVFIPPEGLGAMWLLRMPAASAVGVIVLVSFMPGGWLATPPGGWRAVLALGGASFGYLLIEARNHGVAGLAALGRALVVMAIGAVHALMVSMIGLVVVAPAFVNEGGKLAGLWSSPAYGRTGTVLALATAWCLAVGVFSQILWDDRPITAPLAHLSWRTGLLREAR